jgi:endonuclease/exonuclease/phosphatase family metal-dependent hydrolase
MPRKARTAVKKDKLFILIEWLAARPLLTELTLTAITVLFGMQVLRVLIPDINWVLGNLFGLGALQLGLIGIAIFITGFLSGPLSWLTGNRRLITFTVAGLGLVRLLMQVSWDAPIFSLALAILGTILFILFLPAGFEDARLRGGRSVTNYVLGFLGGLALDTAINGAFGTYDVAWQANLLPVLLTLLIFIVQLVLLIGTTPAIYGESAKSSARAAARISIPKSFTWLAIGPFLFLELVIFQNIPRLATLTGWTLPWAFGLTLVAQLAGLAVASLIVVRNWRMLWLWAFGAGVVLTTSLVFANQQPAALIAILFVIGQVLVSAIMTMVLAGIASSTGKTKLSTLWIANGIGMVLFILLVAAYYAVYQIKLPYANPVIELVAGGIIAACAIGAVIFGKQKIKVAPNVWAVPAFALIILALPLAQIITWRAPAPSPSSGFPVTVMTYNLNDGFNPQGKLDIDEIAKVIENNRPDIVALQEVSRGSLVNGRLDMLQWLSHRLQMPYVYGPTNGPFTGNAILSRYPIEAYIRATLPPPELVTPRGFIVALINVNDTQQLKVISTQFDDGKNGPDNQQSEAQAIIDFRGALGSMIIMGDLNAPPESPAIDKLYRAGLNDAALRWDQPNTYPSYAPQERIDYIWTSPDVVTSNVAVLSSTASNHLPIVASISTY